MALDAVLLNQYRQKLAAHMAGKGTLAAVKFMAFGDGGHNTDGSVKPISESATALGHEVLRKPLSVIKQEDLYSVTANGMIAEEELVGTVLSEAALVDADGMVIGIKRFPPKVIGGNESYEVSLRLRF